MTIIPPEIAVCAYGHTESMFIALLMIPRSNTPMKAPLIVPRPPSNVTPPIIAAVKALQFVSTTGCSCNRIESGNEYDGGNRADDTAY